MSVSADCEGQTACPRQDRAARPVRRAAPEFEGTGDEEKRLRTVLRGLGALMTKVGPELGLDIEAPARLRHTFATLGLEAGVDVLYVAEVLGHSSPAITQAIYQHTRPERKAEAVRRIGEAIFG